MVIGRPCTANMSSINLMIRDEVVEVVIDKAFDTVNHKLLVEKLSFYGVTGIL